MTLREAEGFDPNRIVQARAAASVIPVREASTGWEMLMALRPEASRVAGGNYVWPGGKVDAADVAGSALIERKVKGADHVLDVGPVVAAAVREAFEEVELRLFDPMPGQRPGRDCGAAGFWEWLGAGGGRILADRFHYVMTWLTPRGAPSRFHAHFLLSEVGKEWMPAPHPHEVAAVAWFSPSEALAAFEKGDIQLMFPTYHTIRIFSAAPTLEALRELVARIPTDVIEPTIGPDASGAVGVHLPEFLQTFIRDLGV